MDTSQMLAREFENHSIENRRGQAPAFDMNMAFANPALAYPMSYGAANLGYHPGPGGAAPMNPYGAIMPPQSLYLPSSYTMNQNVSQVRQIPGGAAELHSAHLAKPESKNIDDEAYMFYDMSMQAAQTPRSVGDVNFGTDVDTLMRAIQIKSENRRRGTTVSEAPEGSDRSLSNGPDSDIARDYNEPNQGFPRSRKKYQCNMPSCSKVFFQKTHLEIHIRAHTGAKPFLCKESSCGQRFSQLGNLKTHERRHTGERPYSCDHCGKRFAQRGNVRAHKIVHEQVKPFLCKLENCGKQFTQLGNLKSHQNKFHSDTLRNLTQRFASMREGDAVTAMDKELWEYFATLYKNSNKGIKGRGKDRRIFATNRDDDDKQGRRSRSSSSDCSGHDTSEISENGREKDDSCSSGSVESDEHEQNFIHENNASQGLQGAATM